MTMNNNNNNKENNNMYICVERKKKQNFIFTVADALEVIENKRYDY